jgi:hypothetical protein
MALPTSLAMCSAQAPLSPYTWPNRMKNPIRHLPASCNHCQTGSVFSSSSTKPPPLRLIRVLLATPVAT